MNDHPLLLAKGSHQAGSGKGCAMNVISWENGDTTITDYPACSDRMLSRIVQQVNDSLCSHRPDGLLCPTCSIEVLRLGHRTVGTGGLLAGDELRRVWVLVACDQARSVAHLNTDPRVMAAIDAAERWAENPTAANAATAATADAYAANAANAAAYAYAANAANDADAANAANAVTAAAYAYAAAATAAAYAATAAANAANAAAYAATAAAYAANAADAAAYAAANAAAAYAAANAAYDAANANRSAFRLAAAHRAIDTFNRLTGHTDQAADPQRTTQAVERMLTRV